MRLVLIRHGQTQANLDDALDTEIPGCPLNETGRNQALALPEKWERILPGIVPACIYSSPIHRAIETAKPLADYFGVQVKTLAGLREISAGNMEMSTNPADMELYINTVVDWAGGKNLEYRLAGGETGKEILSRYDSAVESIWTELTEADTAVVITHGAVMRLWTGQRLAGITRDLIAMYPCRNTGITVGEGASLSTLRAVLWSDKPLREWKVIPGAKVRSSSKIIEEID